MRDGDINMRLEIRLALSKDARAIADLMVEVRDGLANPEYYVISDLERVQWKLTENSYAYLAYDGEKLVAFHIFMMPGLDPEENLGYEIDLSEDELRRVACLDSVAVLPGYRGRGLQRHLMKLGEQEALKRGLDIFMATVDPRNTPSLKNFLDAGYGIAAMREHMYEQGLPRAILLKRSDCKEGCEQKATRR